MIAEPIETTTEVEMTRHRFTVAEYMRMAEVDLLGEDSRVELIWGEIVEMSPIYIAHTSTVKRLISLLTKQLGERIILGVQDPVQLSDDSLPQPDIAVLRPQDNFYSQRQPGPDDILLLIEVADTSLRYDRRVKSKLYGAARVDLRSAERLTRHTAAERREVRERASLFISAASSPRRAETRPCRPRRRSERPAA